MNLAPIILFVYNRPWHTKQTLEALMLNDYANQSTLYIYCDGPKEDASEENLKSIKEVREVIREKKWCKEVNIKERAENLGLADNIINGITEIVNKFEKIIVLEDDIVTSKGFLKYMNDALNFYEDNEKVMHIFDDDKFIDPAIKLIESVHPNMSIYFIIQSSKEPFKYVKSDKAESIIIQSEEDERKFVDYIHESNIEVVFFHALNLTKQRLVNSLDKKVIKVWFIWGYDLYRNWPLLNKHIYEMETFLFFNRKKNIRIIKNKLIFNNISFWLFSSFKYKKLLLPKKINTILENNYLTDFYKAAKKIDIVVPVVPNEYELAKKMKINPIYAPFNYVCIEDLLNDKISDNVLQSKNILIGNSADPCNNHLDAFKKIAKLNLKERKVIVPLSYGGSKDYIDYVIEKGNYYFGENFMPLVNFMPLKDYNQLISSCGFVVFNHVRQQAVGNIITLGYMGVKLFLNEKSPVFEYYKSLGLYIYSTKTILLAELNENLSQEKYNVNKNIFFENYSEKAVKEKIEKLFSIVNDELIKRNK